jgi:hypothetical protein
MKLLLFTAAILISCITNAQDNNFFNPSEHLLKKRPVNQFKNMYPFRLFKDQITVAAPEIQEFKLPNGNTVLQLKQDNMPCIIPDMSQYSTTIVLGAGNYYRKLLIPAPGKIPNAAIPDKTILLR